MASTLTIRLTDEQEKQMNELKELLNIKVSTKVVYHLLENYKLLLSQLTNTKDDLRWESQRLNNLKAEVKDFQSCFDQMVKLANE